MGRRMKLDKKVESYLSTMLEGYETNKKQVSEFIEHTSKQVEGAQENLHDSEKNIAELKEMLGIADEAEAEVEAEAMEASE